MDFTSAHIVPSRDLSDSRLFSRTQRGRISMTRFCRMMALAFLLGLVSNFARGQNCDEKCRMRFDFYLCTVQQGPKCITFNMDTCLLCGGPVVKAACVDRNDFN